MVLVLVAVVVVVVRNSKDRHVGGCGWTGRRTLSPIWGLLHLPGEANETFEAGRGWR